MPDHRVELPRDPEAPAAARRLISEWLAGLDRDAVEDVKLLVSEIVTNAVRHPEADGRIGMAVRSGNGRVHVEVTDPGSGFTPKARVGPVAPDALGGRGLLIVDRIATRWGVTPGKPTRVWFELDA